MTGLAGSLIICLFACTSTNEKKEFVDYFERIEVSDTLHFYPDQGPDSLAASVPFSLFEASIDNDLFEDSFLGFPDSLTARLIPGIRFPLDDQFTACQIEIKQSWFVFKYLLIYSNADQVFTTIQPLAGFYGGDGGQIMLESHLFNFNDPTGLQQLFRRMDHGLIPQETGDLKEYEDQHVFLFQWKEGDFVEIPVLDTAGWLRQYPIRW
ncbi:MAG: hypothetical protein GYB31_07610 [Bacteroidetes bacterium]|nr:hypothetical protein [Bacteroidota bacterium]